MAGNKGAHGSGKMDPTARGHAPRGNAVTDNKTRPNDDRIYAEEKGLVTGTDADDRDSRIPKTHENPALEDLRRKREEQSSKGKKG